MDVSYQGDVEAVLVVLTEMVFVVAEISFHAVCICSKFIVYTNAAIMTLSLNKHV